MPREPEEWISAAELAKREGVSAKTIEKAGRKRILTRRKRGLGPTAPWEYPAGLAHKQFTRFRQQDGISVPGETGAASPTMFEMLEELRGLNTKIDRLEAAVLAGHPGK